MDNQGECLTTSQEVFLGKVSNKLESSIKSFQDILNRQRRVTDNIMGGEDVVPDKGEVYQPPDTYERKISLAISDLERVYANLLHETERLETIA